MFTQSYREKIITKLRQRPMDAVELAEEIGEREVTTELRNSLYVLSEEKKIRRVLLDRKIRYAVL